MRAWVWGWWRAEKIPVDAIMEMSWPPSELAYDPHWECK